MTFQAAIHPFKMTAALPSKESFFANLAVRKELYDMLQNLIKLEKGNAFVSEERGNKCAVYFKIERNNLLDDLQEYAAALDTGNIEDIYKGVEQTRFNHLIEVRNNIGIYLPTYFMFPLQVSLKQTALPIFVGSAVKLKIEMQEIAKSLQARDNVDLGKIDNSFEATEEDVEDYEASHEGTENFWAGFSFIILEELVKRSIHYKLPLFVF